MPRLFAIADPHLGGAGQKSMRIFGGNWTGHPEIFFEQWQKNILPDDFVLIAGDISWGMKLSEALPDLERIDALPGKKIIIRGNHDYWWGSISKVRAALPKSIQALQHDSILLGNVAVLGSRGWTAPGSEGFSLDDEKIYKRELERLQLAQKSLEGKCYSKLILMLHYPPTNGAFEPSGFTDFIEALKPNAVVYGHLHGIDPNRVLKSWLGIPLFYVAADAVRFVPQMILEQIEE
ncbi:MAG: metallophosphoesterase [Deinococcales bacterium]